MEVRQSVRYAEECPWGDGWYLRGPAYEPASLADVVMVAAEVERLRRRLEEVLEKLPAQGAWG